MDFIWFLEEEGGREVTLQFCLETLKVHKNHSFSEAVPLPPVPRL